VHPGSGSGSKNAPVSWFLHRIEDWLAQGQGRVAFVSFGEADAEVEKQFLLDGGALPLKYVRPDSLQEFSQLLVDEAALFIGNDSGPAHLAASLGIPTEVVFVSTDPEIWRPLGEVVEVLRLDSRIN
jgi:heptosyltransferase-3